MYGMHAQRSIVILQHAQGSSYSQHCLKVHMVSACDQLGHELMIVSTIVALFISSALQCAPALLSIACLW